MTDRGGGVPAAGESLRQAAANELVFAFAGATGAGASHGADLLADALTARAPGTPVPPDGPESWEPLTPGMAAVEARLTRDAS